MDLKEEREKGLKKLKTMTIVFIILGVFLTNIFLSMSVIGFQLKGILFLIPILSISFILIGIINFYLMWRLKKTPFKKKKEKKNKQGLSSIIITIIIMMFLVLIMTTAPNVSEPHFKITKEECVDETRVIGKKFIKNETISCNQTYQRSGGDKHCKVIDGYECEEKVCKFPLVRLASESPKFIEIRKEPYTEIVEVWEDIIETKTNCKQVEVDVIYPNEEIDGKMNGIIRENLTLKWLDKNAECVLGESGNVNIEMPKDFQEKGVIVNCEKYKYRNYTIERVK